MAQAQTKLTTWQAACIITGYGVGSGIMTLPYLVNRAGIISCIVILLVAFFFSYCMHMMLAEMIIGSGRDAQIVTMFKKILVQRKVRKGPNRSFLRTYRCRAHRKFSRIHCRRRRNPASSRASPYGS